MANDGASLDGYRDSETGKFVPASAIAEAAGTAVKKYLRNVGESSIPGTVAVELAESVSLGELNLGGRPVGLWRGKQINKGIYFMLDGSHKDAKEVMARGGDDTPVLFALSPSDETVEMFEREAQKAIESGEAETVTSEDGTEWHHIKHPASPGETVSFTMNLNSMPAENGKALTLNDVVVWAAVQDAKAAGDISLARALLVVTYARYAHHEQGTRRTRKAEARDLSTVLTSTKAEKNIFGDIGTKIPPITAEQYDGQHVIPLDMKRLKTNTGIRLFDSTLDLSKIPSRELAISHLNDPERYWLTQLQSVVRDNPDLPGVYGTDVLKKAGIKKPLRPDMAGTMREAAEAITRCTQIAAWMDTTGESIGYRDKRIVRSITNRRLVEGNVSLLEYDDGTVDFYVDFSGRSSEPDTTPFPLYDYARDKHELIEAPSDVFKFDRKSCGYVTVEHRRIMTYIYRQAAAKGLQDTILFDTMFQRLGINDTKDSRYRVRKKLEKILDDWKRRKIVRLWDWKRDGRKITGVKVQLNKRYAEYARAQEEAEEYSRNHPEIALK